MRSLRAASLAAIPIALALAFTGCSATTDDASGGASSPSQIAAPQPGSVSLLAPADFAAAAEQPGVVLLDVRTPQEYADGHLDGATNVDLNAPDFADRMAELDPDLTYAVYCRSGNRSATATAFMLQEGFAAPYELRGGILAWQSAGLPVA